MNRRPSREGRYRAPVLVEHDRAGRPLARPYPRLRGRVRWALAVAGVVAIAVTAGGGDPGPFAVAAGAAVLAVIVLPGVLVPAPHPAFLTLRVVQAAALQPQAWIRLQGGWAVQVMNVNLRVPDTVGDPTPPAVRLRCSDGTTRTLRPHDAVTLVQPVDLRRPRRDPEGAALR